MKCRICGAKLKKAGDICSVCYKEFQEEEELKKDIVQKLSINRKYLISYEITKHFEIIVICLLAAVLCFVAGGIFEAICALLILVIIVGGLMAYSKRASIGTKLVFYEKKVVFIKKFLFFNDQKTIKYSDIRDVTYFQSYRQKKFKFGDLCIYTKEAIPGLGYFNGCHIHDVENISETLKQIGEIIGLVEE